MQDSLEKEGVSQTLVRQPSCKRAPPSAGCTLRDRQILYLKSTHLYSIKS